MSDEGWVRRRAICEVDLLKRMGEWEDDRLVRVRLPLVRERTAVLCDWCGKVTIFGVFFATADLNLVPVDPNVLSVPRAGSVYDAPPDIEQLQQDGAQ